MRIPSFAFALLIFTGCSNQAQNSELDWKKIETSLSNSEKRKLLSLVNDPIVKSFEERAIESGSDQIYDLFHVIDLNRDGSEDLIYNGYGGASDEFVMIFIDHNGVLTNDFQTYGHIEDLKTKKLVSDVTILRPLFVGEEGSDTINVFRVGRDKIIKVKKTAKD